MKATSVEPGDLLTTEQVMDRLLADATLRRVAMTCVLTAVRCGNEWRFRKSDLEAWIELQLTGSSPDRSSSPPASARE